MILDGWAGALAWLAVLARLVVLVVGTARRDGRSWMLAPGRLAGDRRRRPRFTPRWCPYRPWLDRMATTADERQMMAAIGEPTTTA